MELTRLGARTFQSAGWAGDLGDRPAERKDSDERAAKVVGRSRAHVRRRGVEGTGPVPSGERRQGQPSPHTGAQRRAACTETTGGTRLGPSGSARGNPNKFCNGLLASRDHPEHPQPRRLLKASGVVRNAKVTADIYGGVLLVLYPPPPASQAPPFPALPPSSAAQTLAPLPILPSPLPGITAPLQLECPPTCTLLGF